MLQLGAATAGSESGASLVFPACRFLAEGQVRAVITDALRLAVLAATEENVGQTARRFV